MDKALATDRASPTRAILRKSLVTPVLVFVLVGSVLGYWQIFLRAPAITYGDAKATHFSKSVVSGGEEIALCFDTVTWYRLCAAELVTSLHPPPSVKATRFDMPVHRISTPLKTGPIELFRWRRCTD